MFDSTILLTKFGSGFRFRFTGVGPGFYSFPANRDNRARPRKTVFDRKMNSLQFPPIPKDDVDEGVIKKYS